MSKTKKNKQADPNKTYGKKIKYLGLGGKQVICPACGTSKKNAMVSEYNNEFYCSEDCVLTVVPS